MAAFRRPSLWLFTMCLLFDMGALVKVRYFTMPVCRVVNASLDCSRPCWDRMWEVTLLMTAYNVTKLIPHFSVISDMPINVTSRTVFNDGWDENGNRGILVTHTASCCKSKVEISAVDDRGNKDHCDFSLRWPSTTVTPQVTRHQEQSAWSNSPIITASLWITSQLLALAALL